MIYSEEEILQYIEENDVKFVKLTFCDGNGGMKNISIPAPGLEQAFAKGIRITAKKIPGFGPANGRDLFLFPDAQTMTPLPWRPQDGRVIRMFCYIRYADGTPFEGDSRYFLKKVMKKAVAEGYRFRFGTSCEFMLFLTDADGCPTLTPHDHAGYCDTAPEDRGENLRRDVCLTLEQMGIQPVSSRHESADGQHEIDFAAASALKAADVFLSFKSAVKSIAHVHGVHASFEPKPLPQESGNGMHITLTVYRKDEDHVDPALQQQAAAGIMRRIREFALFTNSTVNSYERLGEFAIPRTITWSLREGAQLFRLYDESDEEGLTLRAADCACNPYYVFGLMICAAMEGIADALPLPPEDTGETELPHDLGEAAKCAEKSAFLQQHLQPAVLQEVLEDRRAQWKAHRQV
ncbi:MAG: glutamine synthetase [Oscillospiraceae bacterium]|nr:glutamine synthetase [Oscillospiraceae bacterium]